MVGKGPGDQGGPVVEGAFVFSAEWKWQKIRDWLRDGMFWSLNTAQTHASTSQTKKLIFTCFTSMTMCPAVRHSAANCNLWFRKWNVYRDSQWNVLLASSFHKKGTCSTSSLTLMPISHENPVKDTKDWKQEQVLPLIPQIMHGYQVIYTRPWSATVTPSSHW